VKWNVAPPIDRRLGPHAPTVTLDDALDDGQTHAGALEILQAVQPLEHAEQLIGIFHVEAGAIVTDEENLLAADLA
jgi:hypothetical protein